MVVSERTGGAAIWCGFRKVSVKIRHAIHNLAGAKLFIRAGAL